MPRTVLLASDAPLTSGIGKTHRGLIHAFSDRLIKTGSVSRELGRLLKRAEEIRLIADYRGDSVELTDARELVEQAETFVSAMHRQLAPEEGNDDAPEMS